MDDRQEPEERVDLTSVIASAIMGVGPDDAAVALAALWKLRRILPQASADLAADLRKAEAVLSDAFATGRRPAPTDEPRE